jgi:hypothetical protein
MLHVTSNQQQKQSEVHKLERWIRAWMVGHQLEFKIPFLAILNTFLKE